MLKIIKIQRLSISEATVLLRIISARWLKLASAENNSNVFTRKRTIIKQMLGTKNDFTDSKYLFIKLIIIISTKIQKKHITILCRKIKATSHRNRLYTLFMIILIWKPQLSVLKPDRLS